MHTQIKTQQQQAPDNFSTGLHNKAVYLRTYLAVAGSSWQSPTMYRFVWVIVGLLLISLPCFHVFLHNWSIRDCISCISLREGPNLCVHTCLDDAELFQSVSGPQVSSQQVSMGEVHKQLSFTHGNYQ